MGLLRRLFAGPDAAAKMLDAGIKGFDAAWFTKEERAEFVLRYMVATQSQNVARRLIAFTTTAAWLFFLLLAAAAYPVSRDYSAFVMTEVVGVKMSAIVGGIYVFYFGTHLVRAVNNGGGK